MRDRLGGLPTTLTDAALVSVTAALVDHAARGSSPVLDYSAVVIGVMKALETELGRAAELFRAACISGSASLSAGGSSLVTFVNGTGPPPTLGQFVRLLERDNVKAPSQFRSFVHQLSGGYLTRTSVLHEIRRATREFRNPAAHGRLISLDTASRCLDALLGGQAAPGLLIRVAASLPPP